MHGMKKMMLSIYLHDEMNHKAYIQLIPRAQNIKHAPAIQC